MVGMFVLMKYGMSWNFGHLESKTRSLGQIKEMHCGLSRSHISVTVDLKIGPNIFLDETLNKFEFGSAGVIN